MDWQIGWLNTEKTKVSTLYSFPIRPSSNANWDHTAIVNSDKWHRPSRDLGPWPGLCWISQSAARMIPQELVNVFDSFGITEKLLILVLCPAFQQTIQPLQHSRFSIMICRAKMWLPDLANALAARARPMLSKKQSIDFRILFILSSSAGLWLCMVFMLHGSIISGFYWF